MMWQPLGGTWVCSSCGLEPGAGGRSLRPELLPDLLQAEQLQLAQRLVGLAHPAPEPRYDRSPRGAPRLVAQRVGDLLMGAVVGQSKRRVRFAINAAVPIRLNATEPSPARAVPRGVVGNESTVVIVSVGAAARPPASSSLVLFPTSFLVSSSLSIS
jgi:hypothetical protein